MGIIVNQNASAGELGQTYRPIVFVSFVSFVSFVLRLLS